MNMKTRSANGKVKAVKYQEDVMSDNQKSDAYPDCDESSDDKFNPPQKRRRPYTSSSSKARQGSMKDLKGKRLSKNIGTLSRLFDMPVDIFCEIASHLHPLDLLQLSRSIRKLNQVLMSCTSRPIWRAARSSLTGLPDCPPDLSEPEYAYLLFEKFCQVCLTRRGTRVNWILKAQLCKRCRTNCILKGSILMQKIPGLTEEFLGCIPSHSNDQTRNNLRQSRFNSVRVHALFAKYRVAVLEGLPAHEAGIRRETFINQQKALIPIIQNHAASVMSWLHLQRDIKRGEDAEIIKRRVAEIHDKLIALGYQAVDFPYIPESDGWYKLTHQPRDLTPQSWGRLRPKLEACIQKEKTLRDQLSRDNRQLELRMMLCHIMEGREEKDPKLFMHDSDIFALPTPQALFEENDASGPITDERWDESKDQVGKEMDEFSENIKTLLISKIISSQGAASSSSNADLDAAVSSPSSNVDPESLLSSGACFKCTHCHETLLYPEILMHSDRPRKCWDGEKFVFDAATTELAQTILPHLVGQYDRYCQNGKQFFQCLRCDDVSSSSHHLIQHHRHMIDKEAQHKEELNTDKKPTCHDLKLGPPLATILTFHSFDETISEWEKRNPMPEWGWNDMY